jgi:hypothetical protein
VIDDVLTILASQHVAALRMLRDVVAACPAERWEDVVGTHRFGGVAYHALFFADLYLSPGEAAFVPRELHARFGDPRRIGFGGQLPPADMLAYADQVIAKVAEVMSAETPESLRGHCGFHWLQITRGELHIYNIRHVQHHAGGLATIVRRQLGASVKPDPMDWIDHGGFPGPPALRP